MFMLRTSERVKKFYERVFLHYFHLNQITSLQNLIRVPFMRRLSQLKTQSTLHNIGDTYLKRFLINVFQTSAATTSKDQKDQNCKVLRKLLLLLLLLSPFSLLLLFSL